LLWQCGFYNDPPLPPVPDNFVYPNPIEESTSRYKVTWINHSTFLIQADDVTFLTDPIFTNRCSPFSFIGPKRHHQPKPSLEGLPKVDFVLISHNHYDHMDRATLKKLLELQPALQWIVPLGLKCWFLKKIKEVNPASVRELAWYESIVIRQGTQEIKCTSVPAQHFSGRGIFDANKTLWSGFIVETREKCFYFAGDTGYNEIDFKEIGKRYKKIDLSLLPIGIYTPRDFMKPVHINPKEAVIIHKEVGSLLSIGGHWKTFRLASEETERPPFDLYCALKEQGVSPQEFRVLNPGQTISW
jgi:N-acyl-phosphatidylethanolamine-hydrolysing phospholipase D